MAEVLNYDVGRFSDGSKFITQLKRNLVNPGNRVDATDFWQYNLRQSNAVGSVKQRYVNGNVWIENVVSRDGYDVGEGLLSPIYASSYNFPPSGSPLYQEARSKALSKLLRNVQDAKGSDFNLAVFGAEAHKSLVMIGDAAVRLYAAYKAARRGRLGELYRVLAVRAPKGYWHGTNKKLRFPPAKKVSENWSSYWLEARLGWTPLLSDIKSGAEKIALLVEDGKPVCTVRARGTAHEQTRADQTAFAGEKCTSNEVRSTSVEYELHYVFDNPAVAMASSLGLTNPLEVAWELLPASWVWDYIHPVGTFLKALATYDGLGFRSGRLTAIDRRLYHMQRSGYTHVYSTGYLPGGGYGPKDYTVASGCSYYKKQFGFSRGRLTAFPVAQFPSLKAPSDQTVLQKIANVFALTIQKGKTFK